MGFAIWKKNTHGYIYHRFKCFCLLAVLGTFKENGIDIFRACHHLLGIKMMFLGLLEANGAGSNHMYIYIYIVNVHVHIWIYPLNVHETWNYQSEHAKNVGNHHSGGSMILPAPLAAFHLMPHPEDLAYFRIFANAWIVSNKIGTNLLSIPRPSNKRIPFTI